MHGASFLKVLMTNTANNQLSQIKHIMVLMMENRSFDNLLGWLYHDEAQRPDQPTFEGLSRNLWNPLDNYDTDGNYFIEKVPVEMNGQKKYHRGKQVPNEVDFTLPSPDPGEGFKDTNYQLYGTYEVDAVYPPEAVNIGFVNNYQKAMLYGTYAFGDAPTDPRAIMKCFTPDQTPVLSSLAKGFAVCDYYFCSIPSQTLPNRDFVHAATSTGFVNNKPYADCNAKTIFNQIEEAIADGNKDLSWSVYSGESDGKPFSLTRTIMSQLADKKYNANFKGYEQLYKDLASGNMPSYSFIEPQFSGEFQNDQHPPSDIRKGEQFMADLYNALIKSPTWNETLFIITYDEHGGCYDHVAPPSGAKNPDPKNLPGQMGFMFNRFGVRVPTVLISPLIEPGRIFRASSYTPFDHTSIIKTVQKCLGLEGYLTERDKNAPDLGDVLTLSSPRTSDLPDITAPSCPKPIEPDHVNDLHKVVAETLQVKTGMEPKPDESTHSYIGRAYQYHFYS